jgi:AcrR family transcriptional regulator
MRSVRRDSDDLTTRAKIRDAAIEEFGRRGFGRTTIRAIAERSGVSPALVMHHFGSKDGLRDACDAYITQLIDEQTAHAAQALASSDVLAMLAARPDFVHIAPYLTTAMTEGGAFAERLFARLVDDMQLYLEATVAAGVARPTDDERARAELITLVKLGMLRFASYVVPAGSDEDDVLKLAADRLTIPALELFTHGLYTSTDYLDAYRNQPQHDPHGNGVRYAAGPAMHWRPSDTGAHHPSSTHRKGETA